MEGLLRIGDVAARFSISVGALRLYDRKGIIRPAAVDPATGYRYYEQEQVDKVAVLLKLSALGFSLGEIKDMMADCDSGAWGDRLDEKHRQWQLARAKALLKAESLARIKERIALSDQADNMAAMGEDERALLLVKLVCGEGTRTDHQLSEALWL